MYNIFIHSRRKLLKLVRIEGENCKVVCLEKVHDFFNIKNVNIEYSADAFLE